MYMFILRIVKLLENSSFVYFHEYLCLFYKLFCLLILTVMFLTRHKINPSKASDVWNFWL